LVKNILAIGAHPDDIEFGCAGTLLQYRKAGDKIFALIVTRGEKVSDPTIREQECRNALSRIGAEILEFLDYRDTEIPSPHQTHKIVEKIEFYIERIRPDIIFSHSPNDSHHDHRAVFECTKIATRNVPTVLLYETLSALSPFKPQYFVNIENEISNKKEVIGLYITQAGRGFINQKIDAIETVAKFRGNQIGLKFAEGFEVLKMIQ